MLGHPASSQTVCRPSRRTSDLSSVYSGPVFSRVLIHSGLRSIGTWLLRTSRRRSLRPAGSIRDPEDGVGAAVSLMIPTVLADARRPRCAEATGASRRNARSDLTVVRARGGAGARGAAALAEGLRCGVLWRGDVVGAVALDELGIAHAHIGFRRRRVAGGVHGGRDRLAGVAGRSGHGILSVAGHRTVSGGCRGPGVVLL